MTTALYRRYRPDTFQDVIGQEHVTSPLMAALRADRVTHAYLFSGPRGCGKTTSARILARCLNCEKYPTDTPCGECPSCRDLATGGPGSLDVVEIDAASHNGVEDARDLRERASFAPARDRFKIFILDEAHMVTPQGFNALLKLVEEPPAHVKFIFATTEPEKVIGTIRSRTHHYPFRLVPPDVLEGYLAHLCESEGVQVGAGVFPLVTRAGGGSVRDTLSVMDQLMGGAIDGTIDYQRAVALLGYTDTTMLDQCVDAIAAADGAGVFRVIDRVIASGHDPRRFVEDLLQRLRDLLVIALAGAEAGPALGSLPADELARMEVQARTLGSGALSRYADMTAQALGQMVGATSPRLQLELLMARLLVPVQAHAGAAPARPAGSTADAAPSLPAQGSAGGDGRARAAEIARRASAAAANGVAGSGVASGGSQWAGSPVAPAQAPAVAEHAGAGAATGEVSTPVHEETQPAGASPAGAEEPHREPAADSGHDAAPAPAGGAEPERAARPTAPADGGRTAQQAEHAQEGQEEAHAGVEAEAPRAAAEAASAPGAVPAGNPPTGPAAATGAVATSGAAEAEMIRSRWPEVLDAAKRSRRATWALVEQHAQPGALASGVFQVLFTAPGLVNAFEHGGHAPILAEAIHQALGVTVEVHAILVGGDGPQGPEGPGGVPPHPGPAPQAFTSPQHEQHATHAGGANSASPTRSSGSATAPQAQHHADPTTQAAPPTPAASSAPPTAHADEVAGARPTAQASPQPSTETVGWGEVATIGRALHKSPSASSPATPAEAPGTSSPSLASPTAAASAATAAPTPAPSSVPATALGTASGALSGTAGGATTGALAQVNLPHPSAAHAEATPPADPYDVSNLSAPAEDSGEHLATVHRLHALPDLPRGTQAHTAQPQPGQAHTPQARDAVSSAAPEAAATFSDGIPVPEEPGDAEGPGDPESTWQPTSASVEAAMAAARAAARGEALPAGSPTIATVRLEDDVPSDDDEDAEEAGVIGVEVVKRILGATVLEEVTINPEAN